MLSTRFCNVGCVIYGWIHSLKIDTRYGCGCEALVAKMDALGPDRCEAELETLTDEMLESVTHWRRQVRREGAHNIQEAIIAYAPVKQPPRWKIRGIILWGIETARENQEAAA